MGLCGSATINVSRDLLTGAAVRQFFEMIKMACGDGLSGLDNEVHIF
jgi:hypothetical protein